MVEYDPIPQEIARYRLLDLVISEQGCLTAQGRSMTDDRQGAAQEANGTCELPA